MAYNTGNPIGSKDVRDLSDNAEDFDLLANAQVASNPDRFGVLRKTWFGIESDFNAFLAASGFESVHLTYTAGTSLTVQRATQLIDYSGSVYRVKLPATFPVVLSGNWATDAPKLVDVGDASLRQSLSSASYTMGVNLVSGAARVVDTIAQLKTQLKTSTPIVDISAGNVLMRYKIDTSDTTTADNGGTVIVANDGGRWKLVYSGGIDIRWFGAKCDGTTNDTAAVQAAVNFCATFNRWPALMVPGRTLLGSSVNIDRLVDTTLSDFLIYGQGPAAGFYVAGNITMFDSTISVTNDPKSEFVVFKDLQFENSSSSNTNAYVLSQKFLRIRNINCSYRIINYMSAAIYTQTHYFLNCNIRNNQNYFMKAVGSYDLSWLQCVIENGNTLLRCVDTARGTNGLRIHNCVIEGIQTSTIEATGMHGFSFCYNHVEANHNLDLNLNAGTLVNTSMTFIGNYIYNPNGAFIYHGSATHCFSAGNDVSGIMHSNAVQVADLVSVADNAATLSDAPMKSSVGGVKTTGNVIFKSGVGTSVTPSVAGEMVLQFTSNTQATIKAMGSDGVVRSGNITLA